MAMYINTNVPSLTAQRYLGQTNNAVAKSLERLSSGLRINSASDDASGLAISEKLRGQISGLKRASLNAQDGISLLQTAEGGLQNIQDMLQRMRELAVQAGNGVYTTNDRAEIQKEVDQLKEEINRIASSTEFNTKKLLNGDATALWSSDSSDLSVIVKSAVAEGNYNLNVTVDPGKNYVYKSDVMTLNEDAIGAEIVTAGGNVNNTNVGFVTDPNTLASTGTAYYTVTVGAGADTDSDVLTMSVYRQAGSNFGSAATWAPGGTVAESGYLLLEAQENFTVSAGTPANYAFKATFVDAKTGEKSTYSIQGGYDGADNLVFDLSGMTGSGFSGEVSIAIGTDANMQSGDKILLSTTEAVNTSTTSGGGTIAISGGTAGTTGPTLSYGNNELTKADNGDTTIDYNSVTVYHAALNVETGNLDVGNMTLNFRENTATSGATIGATKYGSFDLLVAGGGEAATSTTKLKDIARFTTDDGVNIFAAGPQELTIFGNGSSATIYLEGDDTVSEFEKKLTSAILELGMGATAGTSDESATVNNNLVNYVSTGDVTDNSNEALAGTFVIQTARLGDDSKLSFIGDQNLINALSLATIQKGENSETTIKVTDAHTGKFIGSDSVNDSTLRGVIQGVDVKIDSDVGVSISWNSTKKTMEFSATGESKDIKLHLVDNAMKMQIGANEGQTILANIPQVNTAALGIDDVLMVDQDLAQSSITKLDKALETVSGVRATIGAQINRLEYTMTGLDTTRENLTAAESRIRDLDIADEMAKFTKNQILMQSNIGMLAQANSLPQMALSLLG
ncbi:flagellin N-terminal helical domain-containing protein [Geovibrio ferrireducens]|uniref:flagellin N-terminal helical domain-containing protein n=1 Tax=Geovibrio ferrireducens TaxID=46201 RepID=UPI002247CC17|nr:flagellin [Geovibrio ferrireducens]